MNPEPGASRRIGWLASLVGAAAAAAGVLFFDWPAFLVLALFWCENVIIGVFNAMRMLAIGAASDRYASSLFGAAFFTVHYGIFCLVHGTLLASLFGGITSGDGLIDPVLLMIGRVGGDPVGLLVLASMVAMAAQESLRWWRSVDPHDDKALQQTMSAPYGRIVVLHAALLIGGFGLQALGAPNIAVLILIGLKLAFDVAQLRGSTPPLVIEA